MGSFMALERWGGGEIQTFSAPSLFPPALLDSSGTQPRRLRLPPHTCWRDRQGNRLGCEGLTVCKVCVEVNHLHLCEDILRCLEDG